MTKWALAAGFALFGLACGSEVRNDDDSAGGSAAQGGTGGIGGTGAQTGGGQGGQGLSGGDGGSGASGLCGDFEDQPGTSSVTISIVNEGGFTLYLPRACGGLAPDLTFAGEDPPSMTYFYEPGSCLQTCEDLQSEPQVQCGPCQQTVQALAPGETIEVVWDGTGLVSANMPASCYFDGSQSSCSVIQPALSGAYQIDVPAFAACESFDGGECACDEQGICFGMPAGTEALHDPAQISFPEDAEAEVSFGACAIPCPT